MEAGATLVSDSLPDDARGPKWETTSTATSLAGGILWTDSDSGTQTGGLKQKGIITYGVSSNRQNPFAGAFHDAIFNTWRRFSGQVLYVAPPFIAAYYVMEWAIHRCVIPWACGAERDRVLTFLLVATSTSTPRLGGLSLPMRRSKGRRGTTPKETTRHPRCWAVLNRPPCTSSKHQPSRPRWTRPFSLSITYMPMLALCYPMSPDQLVTGCSHRGGLRRDQPGF